jgi:hypothetical protein
MVKISPRAGFVSDKKPESTSLLLYHEEGGSGKNSSRKNR